MAQGWKLYLERSQGSLVFKYQRRQPGPTFTDFRLFFEVTLGRRIADCVVVALQPSPRCYIVEFKTAMSNTANPQSVTRKAQRLEGTAQLCDCANFLRTSCQIV